jgi:enoyl-CoA hydratase/carnithine racemase
MIPSYFNNYENLAMERTESGILTVRLHTNGGPIIFTGQTHRDMPRALAEIGEDRDNKVVVLTGTGDVFMDEIEGASLGEIFKPSEWDKIYWEGRRVLQRLLEIEAPIIAAINGPARSQRICAARRHHDRIRGRNARGQAAQRLRDRSR